MVLYLQEHLGEWPGPVIEEETNRIVSMHSGFWFYTIGQRSGLDLGHLPNGPWFVSTGHHVQPETLHLFGNDMSNLVECRFSSSPGVIVCRYVVRKDPLMNAVYVSLNYYSEDKQRNAFTCGSFNWLNGTPPPQIREGVCQHSTRETSLYVKVRHGPNMYRVVTFDMAQDGKSAFVKLPDNDQGLAPGQYAVFYQDGVCLGCSVIQNASSTCTTDAISVVSAP